MITNSRVNTLVLDEGCVIISGKASVEMHSFSNVIIEKTGLFEGSIQTEILYVYGKIEGKVVANYLEIFHKGEVECSCLSVKNIRVHNGGKLRENFETRSAEAHLIMHEADKPEPAKLQLVHKKFDEKEIKLASITCSKVNEIDEEYIPKSPDFYNSF